MRFRFLEADDCLFLMKRRSAVEVETYFFNQSLHFFPSFHRLVHSTERERETEKRGAVVSRLGFIPERARDVQK